MGRSGDWLGFACLPGGGAILRHSHLLPLTPHCQQVLQRGVLPCRLASFRLVRRAFRLVGRAPQALLQSPTRRTAAGQAGRWRQRRQRQLNVRLPARQWLSSPPYVTLGSRLGVTVSIKIQGCGVQNWARGALSKLQCQIQRGRANAGSAGAAPRIITASWRAGRQWRPGSLRGQRQPARTACQRGSWPLPGSPGPPRPVPPPAPPAAAGRATHARLRAPVQQQLRASGASGAAALLPRQARYAPSASPPRCRTRP